MRKNPFTSMAVLTLMWMTLGCGEAEQPLVILKAPPVPAHADHVVRKEVRSLAFGSCAAARDSMPALRVAKELRPDVFVWLGDNIYGDTDDMDSLRGCYAQLGGVPDFQALKESVRMLATWDDHDYGRNDAGRHFAQKDSSKWVFLEFWEEPLLSPRRRRAGVYTSTLFDGARIDVHVILLDTRTFRDDLQPSTGLELVAEDGTVYSADYLPHESADSTLLGPGQWAWFKAQLEVPCDVRVIGSSTQFGIAYNGYEAWANFPAEQRLMLQSLHQAAQVSIAGGETPVPTCFISGDVHYGEMSALTVGADGKPVPAEITPVWDITSSGITSTWSFATQNGNRMHGPIMNNNVGLLRFLADDSTLVKAEIWDAAGDLRASQILAKR